MGCPIPGKNVINGLEKAGFRDLNPAYFTLKLTYLDGPLPHAKEMKVQCGGLLGLQAVLFPEQQPADHVANIHALISQAIEVFGGLDQLPYQTIVQAIHHYQVRSPRR